LDVLHVARPVSRVHARLELPGDAHEEAVERRAADAVRRYCRVKIADLDEDLSQIRRYGTWALAIGAMAVLVLNGIARPLDSSDDDLLQLIATGLQIASWVTLWFPINLLVYDRWYARRDQAIYRELLEMEVTLVSAESPLGGVPGSPSAKTPR
jgi:hypothetical protein